MIEQKLTRVEADSPYRCQAVVKNGQCPFKAIEFLKFCPMHAASAPNRLEQEKVAMYRLGKWQQRVREFEDHDLIKSLRSEIGILRMLLEETLFKCQDPNDLLLFSPRITDLISRIEKLVVSCHKLEEKSGYLLSKDSVLSIATSIISVISLHIKDPSTLTLISDDIAKIMSNSLELEEEEEEDQFN